MKIGDGRCVKCVGWVETWMTSEAFAAATRRVAWCSWCGEKSLYVRCGMCGSDVYECMVCGGGMVVCEWCGEDVEVMCKCSRSGGGSCARCVAAEMTTRRINIGGYVFVFMIGVLVKVFKCVLSCGDDVVMVMVLVEEIARGWDLRLAKREVADERAGFIFDVFDCESDY